MRIFRSKIGTLTTVTLVFAIGIGGWVIMERNARAVLWNRTQSKADEISQEYVDTVRNALPLLKVSAGSSAIQQEGIRKLEDVTAEVAAKPDLPILEKLQNVTRMQIAIATLLSLANPGQLSGGPFRQLQEAVGDRGPLSEAIEEYNTLAREWNRRSASFLGSVADGVSNVTSDPLPYLRVDGLDDALMITI